MSEYIAKASIEPRDYRVVFLIQSPEVPKGTFRDCKQSPRSRASPDFGSSPIQKEDSPWRFRTDRHGLPGRSLLSDKNVI